MRKSLLGPFNPLFDEGVHILLSIFSAFYAYSLGLSTYYCVAVFCFGILIDVDHLFNSFIVKNFLGVKKYSGGIIRSSDGYVVKLFHGFDVAIMMCAVLAYFFPQSFAYAVFISISFHLLWDFVVYPFHLSELLLISRIVRRFRPGERRHFVGVIFDKETLRY